MKRTRTAARSVPSLRHGLAPSGPEGAAVALFDDLAACGSAVDRRVLPELARVTPAHDLKRRQKPLGCPARAERCLPHPEPAEVAAEPLCGPLLWVLKTTTIGFGVCWGGRQR